MSTTLQNLRDVFYDLLREEEDVNAYPLTLVDLLLNAAQQKICFGVVVNPLTKEVVNKWQLPFLNSTQFYSNVGTTSLTADTTVWAATLTVDDTTNFSTTWTLYIAWDIITYTWKSSTTFTGCSWVSFAFESGQQISNLFTLPTDFASSINVTYNNRFKLPQKLEDDIFEDLNSIKWSYQQKNNTGSLYELPYSVKPFYTIVDWDYLLLYNLDDDWGIIKLRYEKKPTAFSASTDTATIDNDIFAQTTIPYLAVWEMLFNRWEENRAAQLINFAMWQIREMYTYYNTQSFEKISWVHYKMWKSRLNI